LCLHPCDCSLLTLAFSQHPDEHRPKRRSSSQSISSSANVLLGMAQERLEFLGA
jgi:hypothetical protein